ncbi:hypothetical protein Tco_1165480 [Tanacetum coccineum]
MGTSLHFRQIPLFKYDWVNHRAGGVKRDNLGYTLVDLNNLGHKVDPFILASQARQVFYVKDQIDKKLSIVFKTPPKNYKDTYDEVDEEFSTVIHQRNDNILPCVNRRDLGNESRDDYNRTDCGEIIVVNLDSSSDNNNSDSYSTSQISTSEEIDYDSPEPPKSLLKWYHYLSDEYKDNGSTTYEAYSKAKVEVCGSKVKVEACGSKAKLQGRGTLEVESDVNLLYDVMYIGIIACTLHLQLAYAHCICTLHLQLAFASKHLHIAFADCICTLHLYIAFAACIYKQAFAHCTCTLHLQGIIDSDYAKDPDKGRSITGYAFLVQGCVVSWKATLQHVVALSTTEAEYMALTEAVKEAIWLRGLLEVLGMVLTLWQLFVIIWDALTYSGIMSSHERN